MLKLKFDGYAHTGILVTVETEVTDHEAFKALLTSLAIVGFRSAPAVDGGDPTAIRPFVKHYLCGKTQDGSTRCIHFYGNSEYKSSTLYENDFDKLWFEPDWSNIHSIPPSTEIARRNNLLLPCPGRFLELVPTGKLTDKGTPIRRISGVITPSGSSPATNGAGSAAATSYSEPITATVPGLDSDALLALISDSLKKVPVGDTAALYRIKSRIDANRDKLGDDFGLAMDLYNAAMEKRSGAVPF